MLNLNLELERLFSALESNKNNNPQKILIQLPDGLKPKAKDIQEKIKEKFPAVRLTFWAGSCYGACDVPAVPGYDLLVQFGHSEWR